MPKERSYGHTKSELDRIMAGLQNAGRNEEMRDLDPEIQALCDRPAIDEPRQSWKAWLAKKTESVRKKFFSRH